MTDIESKTQPENKNKVIEEIAIEYEGGDSFGAAAANPKVVYGMMICPALVTTVILIFWFINTKYFE